MEVVFAESLRDIFMLFRGCRSYCLSAHRMQDIHVCMYWICACGCTCLWLSHCKQGCSDGPLAYYIKSLNQLLQETQKLTSNLGNDLNTALVKSIIKYVGNGSEMLTILPTPKFRSLAVLNSPTLEALGSVTANMCIYIAKHLLYTHFTIPFMYAWNGEDLFLVYKHE